MNGMASMASFLSSLEETAEGYLRECPYFVIDDYQLHVLLSFIGIVAKYLRELTSGKEGLL